MGFTVQDMLDMKLFQKANLLWGKGGIGQEIRGVTIIESPDIVRFISGGEVLLTGLNAFQNCSVKVHWQILRKSSRVIL